MVYVVKPKTTFTKFFRIGSVRFMIAFRIPKFMR